MTLQVNDKIIGIYLGDVNDGDICCIAERFTNKINSKDIPATRITEYTKINNEDSRIKKRSYQSFAKLAKDNLDRINGTKYMVVDQTYVGEYIAKMFEISGISFQRLVLTDKLYREVRDGGTLLLVPKREIILTMLALQQGLKLSGGESDTLAFKRLGELHDNPVKVIARLLGISENKPDAEDYQLKGIAITAWYAEYLASQQ